MSRSPVPSPRISLMPEQEVAAIEAATSVDWTTDWPSAAQRAIGEAFSLAAAEPIFSELLRRGLIEARPEPGAGRNVSEGGERTNVRAKYFRAARIFENAELSALRRETAVLCIELDHLRERLSGNAFSTEQVKELCDSHYRQRATALAGVLLACIPTETLKGVRRAVGRFRDQNSTELGGIVGTPGSS